MKRFTAALRNPYAWATIVLFAFCILLHYPGLMPLFYVELHSLLGLERHALERALFLAPIVTGGIAFGPKGGIVCLAIALAAMLPRALFISSFPRDALFETSATIISGALINWWLVSHRRQTGHRDQTIIMLEAIRRELLSHIQNIRENERRLALLHSITTAVNQLTTLEEILDTAAEKIREMEGIEGVLIYLVNERTRELELKAYRGISGESARQLSGLKVGEGLNGWVAQTGEPSIIEDSLTDPRLTREVVKQEGLRSQFIVPLKSKDKVVGTLCAAARSIKHFTKEERDLLMLIGTELGVAVEKAILYQETERVGKSFQELFTKANDAIWIHDFEGRLVTGNRAALKLIGYEPQELIGEEATKFLTLEGVRLAREVRQKLLAGEPIEQPYEQRVVKRDGTEAILMLTTSLLGDEGTLPTFQNIGRDVTRERQLQENLHLYVRRITQAHEEERKRIARELHDDTIQAMIVLSRQMDNLLSNDLEGSAMISQLERIRDELDEALARTRRFIQDLRPPTLDYLGVIPALRELLTQLKQDAKIETELKIDGLEHHFAPEDELMIYRIVQEALSNIWKHSQATKAEVVIEFDQARTRVTIRDNGKGFDLAQVPAFVPAGKIGLAGLQERASLLKGKLAVDSKQGEGTTVTLEIPEERWQANP